VAFLPLIRYTLHPICVVRVVQPEAEYVQGSQEEERVLKEWR
jgi:hypothetical protein